MIKFLTKFFLLLILLLSGATNHLPARTTHDNTVYKQQISSRPAAANNIDINNRQLPARKAILHHTGKKNCEVSAAEIEEEDEDPLSIKKYAKEIAYNLSSFYNLTTACFGNGLANGLPFCNHLSYTASFKYILHRVIRI